MERSELIMDRIIPIAIPFVTAAICYLIAINAPLSPEAIARRALEQSNNPPATASAPEEVRVGESELAPDKVEGVVEWENAFGFKLACISGVEGTVHSTLELLANEIGKDKIPTKYIEMDKTKTVTPDSVKWAWLNYWAKIEEEKKICITK